MPSKSVTQQNFMGIVHALQKGEKVPNASPEARKAAGSMTKKDVKDFASTKHKGLPKKIKKETVVRDPQSSYKRTKQSMPTIQARKYEREPDTFSAQAKTLYDIEKQGIPGTKYAKKPSKFKVKLTKERVKESLRIIYMHEKRSNRKPGELLNTISADLKTHIAGMIKKLVSKYNLSPEIAAIALSKVIEKQYGRTTKPIENNEPKSLMAFFKG